MALGISNSYEEQEYYRINAEWNTSLEQGFFWDDLVEKATKHFSEEEIHEITASPAFNVLEGSCVEIIKNVVDEAILGCYDNPPRSSRITFFMAFDNSAEESISIRLSDIDDETWRDEKSPVVDVGFFADKKLGPASLTNFQETDIALPKDSKGVFKPK